MQKTGAVTLAGGAINTSSPAFLLPASMTLQSGTLAAPTVSSGAVSKATAGTATVNAPLTASLLTVNAGTLILNQGVTAPTVQVNAGTLQAAGTIAGNLTSAIAGSVALAGATTIKGNTTLARSLAIGAYPLVSGSSQQLSVGSLTMAGGAILAQAGVNLVGAAGGYGTIAGKVSGTAAASWTASGASTLGDASDPNGFTGFNGALAAGSSQINLLSAAVANLESSNTLAGGSFASLNGLQLAAGRTLAGYGKVQGDFVNQGAVTGGSGPNMLRFAGAVRGPGSFAGNVQFDGSYSPGNSPAAVSFENLPLSTTSRLDIGLGGASAGSQFDQLTASGALALGGVLRVSLIDGKDLDASLNCRPTLSGGIASNEHEPRSRRPRPLATSRLPVQEFRSPPRRSSA